MINEFINNFFRHQNLKNKAMNKAHSALETKSFLHENDDFRIYLNFKEMCEQQKSWKLADDKIVIINF